MHTAARLRSDAFSIELHAGQAALTDLFPGFGVRDRLGVVIGSHCGSLGVSSLTLAAVTAFYDFQRQQGERFFIYPDYYAFHIGRQRADHQELDIWPPHKEVVVPADPEQALQAIVDRGITLLAVEDTASCDFNYLPETRASALALVRSALAFSPTGRSAGASASIRSNELVERHVNEYIKTSTTFGDLDVEQIRHRRAVMAEDGTAEERYRQLSLPDAIAMIAGWGPSTARRQGSG